MEQYKTCRRCSQNLPRDKFSFRKAAKDNLSSWCKPCFNAYVKDRRLADPESYRESVRKSRAKNKSKALKGVRKWREANKPHIAEYQRLWRKKNADLVRNHSIVHNSIRRARLNSHEDYLVTAKEISRLKNNSCFFCGSYESIEIDHVIPISRGGRHSIGNLMTLCRSCNRRKSNKTIIEFRMWMKSLDF